jgi:polyferredoxin
MKTLQYIGLSLFLVAIAVFTFSLGWSNYELTAENIGINNEVHREAILAAAEEEGMFNKTYSTNITFISDFKSSISKAQEELKKRDIPEGTDQWDIHLGNWKIQEYTLSVLDGAAFGGVHDHKGLMLFLTFGLGLIGGLLYILPKFMAMPGIKNDHIYHSPLTRGLTWNWRAFALGTGIVGILIYGFFNLGNWFWPMVSAAVAGLIIYLVFYPQNAKENQPPRSASPDRTAWLGILVGVYFIGFYVLLYWAPIYIQNAVAIVDPVSQLLSGGEASQWFLYGLIYTLVILVMGVRMFSKYQHNRYQLIRTGSVMFFQTSFAFLIPEILVRLNQPYFDFKNIWPLDYDFFFQYNLNDLLESGTLGLFMLVWGIALIILAVPIITYFFGKRWYCSWVCGCGGLAETLGDPYRQLSDKSLRAWKFERWIIHGVLVAAVLMTGMVLYTYFTGNYNVLFMNSDNVRAWYGFLIGAGFSGVVGTGFYPLMGNRVWCRFGCPLAAYLGLVQRFKSRFRITTNGGQCISCGNCSTYCEMGIDVRAYAQKGQDILRSSCVGCGVCAAVCPRGVLRLENAAGDVNTRTEELRAVHVGEVY